MTNNVDIRPVQTRADLKRFIEYPYQKYKGEPHWVPPLLIDEWAKFNPKKNPFYQHARMDLFLAEQDGHVVGRIGAIDDDNHNKTHDDNLIFFGFFEAETQGVADALLGQVEAWGKQLGRSSVRGPANPSMNDGSGFQIDAFDTDPFIMMPQNPPEYPQFMGAAGYSKVKDLYAWLVEEERGLGERLTRLIDRIRKRYQPLIRPVDLKQFDRELGILKMVHNKAWEDNWGAVKYTDAEFDHLASDLKMIIDPDIALIAEVNGEVAGLAIGLPDANQVFKRVNGRLLPFGIFTLLNRKRYINQLRLPILGLMPKYRRSGLELVLIDEVYRRGTAKGYRCAECSWLLEDNDSMNSGIRAANGELYKTYRLYQKELGIGG